jgi:hypothetical protein
MAIIKMSKNGKVVLIVGDDGTVYFTSTTYFTNFLTRGTGFIQLKKFPIGVPKGKFKPSEVFDPSNLSSVRDKVSDGMTGAATDLNNQQKAYMDKVVDW